MQVSIKTKNIRKALELSYAIVEKKTTLPVLANIKIEALPASQDLEQAANGAAAGSPRIRLTSTDMFMSYESTIPADVMVAGPITVPARTFFDIVRKVKDEDVITLTSHNGGHSIKIDLPESNFSLPTLPAEEFPVLEANDNLVFFDINAEILLSLLDRTKHAVSQEEIRYYLNGVFLHTVVEEGNKYLVAVATDGHRLAKVRALVGQNIPDIAGIIIHKKTIAEVVKLLEESVGDVTVGVSQNKIMFKNDNHTIVSKIVDGKFPDYNKAIPQAQDKSLVASASELARAVDLVTSVSSDRNRAVRLAVSEGKITISTSSEFDGAKGTQAINAEYNAEPITFAFNSKYVLDCLSAVGSNQVRLSFSDSMAAVVCEDPQDNSFISILMPMQI